MSDYYFLEHPGDGIYLLFHQEFGRQVWTKAKTRKVWECEVCRKRIEKGQVAYRPITNGYNRMCRICEECMEQN
jgi:hypothetical protein